MLLRQDVRLLTLTGPAGAGKTRLALAVLDAVRSQFPDGAFFVDLAPLADPHLVVNAIAQTLGVRDAGDLALVESVRAHLREQRLVLLLDNFEQVLDAAPVVADLLAACSDLKVLRRLAVFVGGWTLEAAAAICGEVNESEADLLDRLAVLVDSNLVRQAAFGAEPRFTFLETMREYATERLFASDEAAQFYERHSAYFLALAEAADPKLMTSEQLVWLARLEAEHDNLRAALARSLGMTGTWSDAALALRLAGALGWFWWMRGHFSEGRRWLNAALAAGEAAPVAPRAKALHGAGMMAYGQGDFDQALALQEGSRALWQEAGDMWGVARGCSEVSLDLRRLNQEYERSVALMERALALFRQLGDRWHAAWCLWMLPAVAGAALSTERVVALYEEALALFRQVGDAWGTGLVLGSLADLEQSRGNLDRAEELLDEAIALLQTIGARRGLGLLKRSQGQLARTRGKIERAGACYVESLHIARDTGDKASIAAALFEIGKMLCERGDFERAARLFGIVTTTFALRNQSMLTTPNDQLGQEHSSRTFPWSRSTRMMHPDDGGDLEQYLATIVAALGTAGANAGREQGTVMSLDEAIAYGLTSVAPGTSKPPSPGGQSTLLTPRERDVVLLLARGLTNRQIADSLVITERTVAAHVEHLLGKLGFTSRTQVALWAVEQKPLRLLPRDHGRNRPSPRRRQDA
jgi:non-specific serine/threonine protein kinase